MTFTEKDLVDAMTMGMLFGAVLARPEPVEAEYIPPCRELVPARNASRALAAYRRDQEGRYL